MDHFMYYCPDCQKLYKIVGEGKRAKCNQCGNIIVCMDVTSAEWDTLSKEQRNDIKRRLQGNTPQIVNSETAKSHSFFSQRNEEIINPRFVKLVDLTCPKCGAAIQVNPELQKYICGYCGSELLVEDEIQKSRIANGRELGYQQERGRQDAIASDREKLLQLLSEVRGPLADAEWIYLQYTNRKKEISTIKLSSKIITFGGGFLIAIILMLPLSAFLPPPVAIIILLILCPSILEFRNLLKKQKRAQLQAEIDSLEEKYASMMESIKDQISKIPPDYRYSTAIESFYKYVNNQRADNIRDAMNLYEEEMHRLRLENAQEAILRENQKQTSLQANQLLYQIINHL